MNVPEHMKPFIERAYTNNEGEIILKRKLKCRNRNTKTENMNPAKIQCLR